MNFTPEDMTQIDTNNKEIEVNLSNRLDSYTIARVQFTNSNTMKLDFIDGGYVYDQIKAGRMKIKNETDELYDTFLITASTTELQQFFEKYGDDSRFFNKENSVTLNRKSWTNEEKVLGFESPGIKDLTAPGFLGAFVFYFSQFI